MKNNFLQLTSLVAIFSMGCIHSCKKDMAMTLPSTAPADSVISTSFIEEFADVPALYLKGWTTENFPRYVNQSYAGDWIQGAPPTPGKNGTIYGYPAYSYYVNKDEYIYSPGIQDTTSFSSWLITPVLSVKNGDKISFYAYADGNTLNTGLQLLMSASESYKMGDSVNSIGNFSVLLTIPDPPGSGSFPYEWTKFEYTFSGVTGNMKTRIGLRHYTLGQISSGVISGGIGIDQFKFEVSK